MQTKIKNRFAQNCKIVIFNENDIAILRIFTENRVATYVYQVVTIIKFIPYKNWHQIQMNIGLLDFLYLIIKLHRVLFVDLKYYKAEALASPCNNI